MIASQKTHGISLDAVVFVCGAVVMIFEITGSRVLAPYIGTSTYIWTSLIGVILGALSLGYWLGGRMADRVPKAEVLAALILFAPAGIALGFVTPYAVKLRMGSLGEAGRTVGRLYALSTVGSIAGTFLAGFVFIPFLG